MYGYDNIPEERMADVLPMQRGNPVLDKEERVRDLLVSFGLQEVISYRWSTPEKEARRIAPGFPADDKEYVKMANPFSYDRTFLRHSVLSSVLDTTERNSRVRPHLAFFEIGPVFLPGEDPSGLPDELKRLAIVLSGQRELTGWQSADTADMDFFDLKGVVEGLAHGLRLPEVHFEAAEHPTYHPGKCAKLMVGGKQIGVFGELHPRVRERYDWPNTFKAPVMGAEFDLDLLLSLIPPLYQTSDLPTFPPVLEDLALVVDETVPAVKVEFFIRQTGGKLLSDVRLFDIFRSEALGEGKKSLAYSLTYQAPDRTLKDDEIKALRSKIIKRLEHEVNAKLRA